MVRKDCLDRLNIPVGEPDSCNLLRCVEISLSNEQSLSHVLRNTDILSGSSLRGGSGGIRTHGQQIKSLPLYLAELRTLTKAEKLIAMRQI